MSEKAKKLGLEFKAVEGVLPWDLFQPEIAEKDGIKYCRKKDSTIVYKENGKSFVCLDCDSEILMVKISKSNAHVRVSEKIPYCPKCEEEPSSSGITYYSLKTR